MFNLCAVNVRRIACKKFRKESGSLEQDADIVMFLYRDEYYNGDDTDERNLAELIIAKNRHGPTTSIRLLFQGEIVRFNNLL